MKISLFIKPLMLKVCLFAFIFIYILMKPSHTNAGFFSNLITKIVGPETQASEIPNEEESIIHNSQNVPLLESSINPDLKNIKDEPPVIALNEALLSNNGALGVDSELEKYDSSVKITTYIVKKGDTLEGISNRLKVPKSTIIASNADLKKSDLLKIGQKLTILAIKATDKPIDDKTKKENKTKPVDTEKVVIEKEEKQINDTALTPTTPIVEPLPPVTPPSTPVVIPNPMSNIPEEPKQENTPTGQPTGTISGDYIWPFPVGIGRVSQGLHADQAYDFAAPKGTPIYAVQDGNVLIADKSGYNGGYGLYVVIDFNDGRQAIFGHMSKVVAVAGQDVKKGDIIGYVGSTGKSTGPHLHLGFHGELRNPYIGLKINDKDLEINE